jgi:hypothetical protein
MTPPNASEVTCKTAPQLHARFLTQLVTSHNARLFGYGWPKILALSAAYESSTLPRRPPPFVRPHVHPVANRPLGKRRVTLRQITPPDPLLAGPLRLELRGPRQKGIGSETKPAFKKTNRCPRPPAAVRCSR